jgi:hypothetical protein
LSIMLMRAPSPAPGSKEPSWILVEVVISGISATESGCPVDCCLPRRSVNAAASLEERRQPWTRSHSNLDHLICSRLGHPPTRPILCIGPLEQAPRSSSAHVRSHSEGGTRTRARYRTITITTPSLFSQSPTPCPLSNPSHHEHERHPIVPPPLPSLSLDGCPSVRGQARSVQHTCFKATLNNPNSSEEAKVCTQLASSDAYVHGRADLEL